MKLYEINQRILELLQCLEPDPETGEVLGNVDDVISELDSLEMQKSSILEYLAKLVLSLRAEQTALKAEEERLRKRRKAKECKESNLLKILDRECAGQKTDCGVATMSYRKTSRIEILEPLKAFNWLKRHGHKDCYRIADPEISKTEVKKLLQSGEKVPGLQLTQDTSYSLR